MKTEENIIKRMRDTLVPQGTLPIVRLHTGETSLYVDHDFVKSCIDDLEKLSARAVLGDKPNNLERLAFMLLCESACIKETK